MNWLNKFLKTNLFRSIVILMAAGLVISLAIESKSPRAVAQNNPPDPTKTITDLNGQAKTAFAVGESGRLTLRGYADSLAGGYDKADIILTLDGSGSMAHDNKCADAKQALTDFAKSVNITKQTQIGLVDYYNGVGALYNQLALINSAASKNTLLNNINLLPCGNNGVGSTPMGQAVQASNSELISVRARTGTADKYIILFTDGNENSGAPLNGSWFTGDMNNRDYPVGDPSILKTSIDHQIKYFTVQYSAGDACDTTSDGGSYGCPLMRFAAARTNGVTLNSPFTWVNNYGSLNGIDGISFFKTADPDELADIYRRIIVAIEGFNGANLSFYEKLPTQVRYDELESVKDKGGRPYYPRGTSPLVRIEDLGSNQFKISTTYKVPKEYVCGATELKCINAAGPPDANGVYHLTNNYLEVKIKVTFVDKGKFDLDSNYSGCDVGNPQKTASDSRVEYFDPTSVTAPAYASLSMPRLCLNIFDLGTGEVISKSTYKADQSGNLTLQGSFEAGDEVVVKLSVNEVSAFRSTWKIEDKVPSSVKELSKNPVLTRSNGDSFNLIPTFNDDTLVLQNTADIGSSLLGGLNVIEYRYKI